MKKLEKMEREIALRTAQIRYYFKAYQNNIELAIVFIDYCIFLHKQGRITIIHLISSVPPPPAEAPEPKPRQCWTSTADINAPSRPPSKIPMPKAHQVSMGKNEVFTVKLACSM